MTDQREEPELIAEFELDDKSVGPEEIDIIASVLADLLRDTEARLKERKG